MIRRFELGDKFWVVDLQQHAHATFRWGKLGTPGQSIIRAYDPAVLTAKIEELIAARVQEGYREVSIVTSGAERTRAERWTRRYAWGDQRFVEFTLDGRLTRRRIGVIGQEDLDDGTADVITHPSEDAARDIVERLIKHDPRVGRMLVEDRDPRPLDPDDQIVRSACNPTLEAECRASPDDADAWAVFSDWLMSRGDIRGELAALRVRGTEAEAEAFMRGNCSRLFGRGEILRCAKITRWRHGFPAAMLLAVDRDATRLELDELTTDVLELPIAQFVESLRFGLASDESDNDWGPTIMAVAASPVAAHLRELLFDSYDSDECELSWTPFGDFSRAWDALPALEVLHIRSGAGGTLGALELPSLLKFVRESGGLDATELEAICHAKWPTLRHLEIWLGAAAYDGEGSIDGIRPILAGVGLPVLDHLGIVNSELDAALIHALASSKILRQLRTLDLSKGIMASAAADALVEHAREFAHLAWIDLDSNFFTPEQLSLVARVLPQIRRGTQRGDGEAESDDDGEENRYVAVGE